MNKMMDIKSDYKMTDLGEIPSEWEIYPLKEVTSQIGDGNYSSKYPKSADFIESGIPFLRANNLKNGKLSMKDMKYISLEQHESLKKGHIKVGDIIITVRGQIGNVAITTKEFDDVNINAQLAFLRFNDQISSKFILYFLQSTLIQNLLFSITTGTALQQLPINRLNNLRIIVPPLNEQQKIAEILSTVDEQIEQTDQLIEKTKELKKGFMQQLLTKGIGHTEFKQTELGEIPDEWSLLRLQEVLKVMYGKSQTKVEVEESDIPILGTGGIIGWSKEPLYSKKSVLIGRKGTIDKPVYIDKPFWTIDTLFYTDIETTKADVKFIYYLFQSIDWYRYNEATGVPSLSSKNILNILFACPSLKEQKRIASILSAVDEDIEGYEKERAKYEELKKGLMQQLLTGKTRVKVD